MTYRKLTAGPTSVARCIRRLGRVSHGRLGELEQSSEVPKTITEGVVSLEHEVQVKHPRVRHSQLDIPQSLLQLFPFLAPGHGGSVYRRKQPGSGLPYRCR